MPLEATHCTERPNWGSTTIDATDFWNDIDPEACVRDEEAVFYGEINDSYGCFIHGLEVTEAAGTSAFYDRDQLAEILGGAEFHELEARIWDQIEDQEGALQ